ncbi:hypothetical protein SKAU_G00343270 [Synaphobranchus kaupii]|uniref:Ig-like domain-containing protein n=1 Tax=Synaphobranchus kaupii TaxID=118154 RepID=A0A9Q1EIY7_SYNKA|nr:hypothetical protein SKAU_G00343270 [Synaphobranchus kaupii]
MALRSTVPASFYLLVIPSVLQAVASPSTVKGTFGDSVTLPCNGSAYRGSTEDQLDVLWQTAEGKKVARFSRGVHSAGLRFEQRLTFLTENIRRGIFSIAISSIAFSDEDAYQCVWSKGQDSEKFLSDVKLQVSAPSFLKSQSVSPGDPVTLPCYGHVAKVPEDKLFLQWRKGDELVLQLSSGEFTFGGIFSERASMSLDRIQQGDFSLSLSVTGVADRGTYLCSTDRNQTVTTVSLKVKDHRAQVILETGMDFNISVPRVPLMLYFFKSGSDVLLCELLVDYARCKSDHHRVAFKDGTLQIRNVQPSDGGRYTMRERYNDIIIKEISLRVTFAFPEVPYGMILMVMVLLIVLVLRRLRCGPRDFHTLRQLISVTLLKNRSKTVLCKAMCDTVQYVVRACLKKFMNAVDWFTVSGH